MRKTWALIVFLILTILLLVVLIFIVPKQKEDGKNIPTPTPSSKPIIFDPKNIDQNTKEFSIIDIKPDLTQPLTDRYTPLEITFNKPVAKHTIKVTPTPNVKIQTNLYQTKIGSSVLEIVPIDPWQDQTNYQLVLNNDIRTEDGTSLGKDYVINFKVEAYLGL